MLKTKVEFLETVILASAYISPIICFGIRSYEEIKPLVIDEVQTASELNDKDVKLHLRIADYTVIDFYSWSTQHVEKLWKSFDVDKFIGDRKKKISGDKKRYWRVKEGNISPKPFISYLDLAQFAASDQSILRELNKLPKEEVIAGLAIVPTVILAFV